MRAIGDLDAARGRLDAACIAYSEARMLYQMIGDRVAEADVLTMVGIACVETERQTAVSAINYAARLYRAVGCVEWQRRLAGYHGRLR